MIDAADLVNLAPQIAAIETVLYSLEDRLSDVVGRHVGDVEDGLGQAETKLAPVLANALDAAEVNLPGELASEPLNWSGVERIAQQNSEALQTHENSLAAVADNAVASVNKSIESMLPGVNEVFAGLVRVFGNLIDGLLSLLTTDTDLWQTLVDTLKPNLVENQEGIGHWLWELINAVTAAANGRFPDPVATRDLMQSTRPTPAFRHGITVEEYIHGLEGQPMIVQSLFNVFSMFAGVITILNARIAGYLSGVTQASLAESLTTPLSTAELVHLVKLQAVGIDFAKEHATRSGVSGELFDLKLATTEQLLPTESILDFWRRTGDDSILEQLRRIGYSDDSIDKLRALSLATPTASDVVRFLARDVFDSGAIAAGGLDADFAQKYNEPLFNAAGVSRDTALLYWMAHWSLPSPTMGYEMFHRGIITQSQLEDLLKLADYAPGWVSKMVDIAYLVPGRIDVRRMHASGIIADHAALVLAYQRMGYSPDDSETFAVFTEKLTLQANEAAAERRSATTARAIVHSFVVGTLSEVQARDDLVSLGYTAERATELLAEGIYGRESNRADRIRDAVGREYVRGYATKEEAASRLASYGFEDAEINFLFDSWDLDRELAEETEVKKHAKDLTRSEIIAAYANHLLSRDDASAALVTLGYDEAEAGTLLQLEDAKEARADASVIEQAIRAQFLARTMSAADARSGLEGAGFAPSRVAALLTRWETELEQHRPHVSNAQLERMLMQGVIDQDTLQSELERRGYAEHDVNMLLTLWGSDMSIAADKLEEQKREFQIREARLSEQGAARIGLQGRGLDIRESQFSQTQSAVQQRFDAAASERERLQQARLDSASALTTQRIAAETTRAAASLEASHQRQLTQIQADQDKLQKQIDAAAARQQNALNAAQAARDQAASLRAQAQAAQDARQAASLASQADRQARTIEAANARADAALAQRQALENQREIAQGSLVVFRDQLAQAKEIRATAARIDAEARAENQRVRTEQRASARKGILAADAAANAAQLQAVQLNQASAIADVNARFAALQAEIAVHRQQAALDARAAAERALHAATPASALLTTAGS